MTEHVLEPEGIYYRTNVFSDQRPTLIFIHGLSGSSSAWFPYERRFESRYNILTFDLRGHGKSVKPSRYEDYAIPRFADDLRLLVQRLMIRRCSIVAHSFGVLVALAFIEQHSTKVEAAIFLSPSMSVNRRGLARLIRPLLSLTAVFALFPFSGRPKGHVDYRRLRHPKDWDLRMTYADVRTTSLRVYLFATKQSYAFNPEIRLAHITFPTLLIHGRRDSVFPIENSIAMAKKLHDTRLVILDQADHIVVLNNIEDIIPQIEHFLASISTTSVPGAVRT